MPTRAVLFGFDGVLADTENVRVAAWQRTFRAMGWHESDESCVRAGDRDDRVFVAEVFARRKIEGGDVAGWAGRKQALMIQLLRDRPLLQPGVAALVQTLKEAGAALAVVTAAPRGNVEAVLAGTGLLDAFEVLVTGEDHQSPRFDSSIYQLATRRLGVGSAEAVLLVDADADLSAARKVGLRVVAVGSARPDDETPWVANLADQPGALAALGL